MTVSQSQPMELNPDDRVPSFVTGGGDTMDQDRDTDELSDGEGEQELEDVQALFRENISISGSQR